MRVGRAQHHRMDLARPNDVVEVMPAPGQEAPILDATNRLTDAELCHDDLRTRLAPHHRAPRYRNPCGRRYDFSGAISGFSTLTLYWTRRRTTMKIISGAF